MKKLTKNKSANTTGSSTAKTVGLGEMLNRSLSDVNQGSDFASVMRAALEDDPLLFQSVARLTQSGQQLVQERLKKIFKLTVQFMEVWRMLPIILRALHFHSERHNHL